MENGKIKVWFPTIRVGTGTDIFTRRLATALEKQGLLTQITWFPPRYEQLAPLLRFSALPTNTDIIFSNSWSGFTFKRSGIPLIVTVHHSGFDSASISYKNMAQRVYHDLLIRPYEKKSFEQASAITTVSAFVANSIRQHVRAPKKIHVIHNWIDTDIFCPSPVAQATYGKFRLLFVGKLSRLKGADLLVSIMKRLGDRFELWIAGNASNLARTKFPANVRWLGRLDEPALVKAYQQCDAMLFPSRSEGFGYVALEAMACGKPVIASDATALPELVEHNVTGFLCPPDNIEAFTKACIELANDPRICLAMGVAARNRAIEEFSEEKMLSQYVQLIRSLTSSQLAHDLP